MLYLMVFKILRKSGKLPQELWDMIFSEFYSKGYCVLKDFSIVDFSLKCKEAIYISFPNVKKINTKFIDYNDKVVLNKESLFPELIEVFIPPRMEYLDNYLFSDCYKLEKVSLSKNILEIGKCAFSRCVNLKKIKIPDSCHKIGRFCFFGCSNLKEVRLSKNIKRIPSRCFSECHTLKEIDISEGIEFLSINSFSDCHKLEKVIFPKSIKKIGNGCFVDCYNLESIDLEGTQCIELGTFSFRDCVSLTEIKLPIRTNNNKINIGLGCFVNTKYNI